MSRSSQADEELEQFVAREYDHLRRVAISLTGDPHDADDLMQDTLAKVLVNWRRVKSTESPTRYARRIMANVFLTGKRRRASTEVISSEVVDRKSESVDPTAEFVQRHDLLSAVLQLPPNQRVVIVLRYLEDLPVAEVAKILGKREGAVRGICHRGLEGLRGNADRPPPRQRAGQRTPVRDHAVVG